VLELWQVCSECAQVGAERCSSVVSVLVSSSGELGGELGGEHGGEHSGDVLVVLSDTRSRLEHTARRLLRPSTQQLVRD